MPSVTDFCYGKSTQRNMLVNFYDLKQIFHKLRQVNLFVYMG